MKNNKKRGVLITQIDTHINQVTLKDLDTNRVITISGDGISDELKEGQILNTQSGKERS